MTATCNDKCDRWFFAGFILTAIVLASLFLLSPKVYASNCDILNVNNYPSRQGIPDTAIDTAQIPQVVIDSAAADDMPLPVYRLADST